MRFARLNGADVVINICVGDPAWPTTDSRNTWVECGDDTAIGDVYSWVGEGFNMTAAEIREARKRNR